MILQKTEKDITSYDDEYNKVNLGFGPNEGIGIYKFGFCGGPESYNKKIKLKYKSNISQVTNIDTISSVEIVIGKRCMYEIQCEQFTNLNKITTDKKNQKAKTENVMFYIVEVYISKDIKTFTIDYATTS